MFGWDVIRKGVDLLIQSAEQLGQRDCKVLVVGGEACKNYLEENHAGESICYREPVKDVNGLFTDARAFLHISRAEGLSYALLEAIYAGLPVICSDIPENLFAGEFKNVFFVRNEDAADIAQKMEQLLNWDGILQEADVSYNREMIRKKYAMSAWVDRMMAQYQI